MIQCFYKIVIWCPVQILAYRSPTCVHSAFQTHTDDENHSLLSLMLPDFAFEIAKVKRSWCNWLLKAIAYGTLIGLIDVMPRTQLWLSECLNTTPLRCVHNFVPRLSSIKLAKWSWTHPAPCTIHHLNRAPYFTIFVSFFSTHSIICSRREEKQQVVNTVSFFVCLFVFNMMRKMKVAKNIWSYTGSER